MGPSLRRERRPDPGQGAYDTLQAFLRPCDCGGPNCAFSDGNPKVRYDRLVSRYLLSGRVPPRGTVCPVDVVPFAEPVATAQAAQASAHAYLIPPTLAQAQRD